MKKESENTLIGVTIFAIAMGFLETAVVVYLRKLYYPNGFSFPLKGFLSPEIISVEAIREIATIIMLLAVGYLAGKKLSEKFAYFIYAFAIWDISYYVFLKITLAWPQSLFTWDLLFLIPWAWAGPVITPILSSLLLITMALLIIHFNDKGKKVIISRKEWTFLIIGVVFAVYTWLYDSGKIIFNNLDAATYVPTSYNWAIFWLSIIATSAGIISFYLRNKSSKK